MAATHCSDGLQTQRHQVLTTYLPFWRIEMQIKDLSLELDTKALSAVRGGGVSGANIGAIVMGPVAQFGGSGLSFASPSSNTNVQAPTLSQTNVGFDNDTAALIGSAVGLFQMA
jgi:hypothetical protein